ncbi:MAG: 50S ribosomal protein L17 [Deltaproteobacteria bacterium CG11_big_fil_rev_8_21_14_0_20_47_16]|nr:MAG: 50S ribosomal protein L17 [Deltaproteobacteria bacterium CG11_big_fil_rev_8_21_14_0_20_47_16]
MRHLVDSRKLGRTTSHRLALFRNMLSSLILHDRIETTLPKAKELRRWADWMVSLGKDGSLSARRRALRYVQNDNAIQKLFTNLADRFKARNGGYTRIMRLGNRHGDNAPMAIIEYLSAEIGSVTAAPAPKAKKAASKTAKSAAPKSAKAAAKKPAAKKTAKAKTA